MPLGTGGVRALAPADRLYRTQEQLHKDQTDCPRPYILHVGDGSVLAVGQNHELVEPDHHDPFTVVYLAAGRLSPTLAAAFEVSPADGSITTERVVYDDGSAPLERQLSSYTSPITPLPARFADRHQAALAELERKLTGIDADATAINHHISL